MQVQKNQPITWNKFKSIYIPHDVMVTMIGLHDYKGPYYGPCILPNLDRMKSNGEKVLVKLTDHPNIDSRDMVIVADQSKFSKTARYMNYFQPIGIKINLNGGPGSYWMRSIKSMILPKGKQITGYGSGEVYGPYIGFIKLEEVEGSWTDIKIEDNSGEDKILKLCTKNDFSGKCEQLLISNYEKDIWYPLNNNQGINFHEFTKNNFWDGKGNVVRSFDVPAGTSVKFTVKCIRWTDDLGPVNTYTPTEYEMGTYIGPFKTNVENTDSIDGDNVTKEKIIKVMFVKT